ncbi:MAG: hypothetical protein RL473_446, partial [Actinomycetota bacterium]
HDCYPDSEQVDGDLMLSSHGSLSNDFTYQSRCPLREAPGPNDLSSRDICTSRCRQETTSRLRVGRT